MEDIIQNCTKNQNDKGPIVDDILNFLDKQGYDVVEVNTKKPWGAYIRIGNDNAERFIEEYFPGLTLQEACMGVEHAVLSPKILIVSPQARLSWQMHHRRAERWRFLTEGYYCKNKTDDQVEPCVAQAGDVVQFAKEERHRLLAHDDFVFVAEIWQHTDPNHLSDEDDIVRIQDDYAR